MAKQTLPQRLGFGQRPVAASSAADVERLTIWEAAGAYLGSIVLTLMLIAADRFGVYGAGRIPYANHDGCDVWFYFSQIISPSSGSFLAEGTRFISRALFVAPPHLLRVLFPSLDPNMASYLFFLPLAIAALYLGLRALFGRRTSAAGAFLIGTAPMLINLASATYVGMGAGAYETCMLACLLWTGRLAGMRPLLHFLTASLGGMFFIFAANANMMAIKFDFLYVLFAIPVQFLAGPARSPAKAAAWVTRAVAAFVLGSAAGALVAFAASYALGLGFYTPLLQVAEAIHGVDQSRYPSWSTDTVAFALLALISILAALSIYRQRGSGGVAPARVTLVAIVAVGSCVFHLVSCVAFGDMSLIFDWFYFLILPCVALTFCAAFGDWIEANGRVALLCIGGTVLASNLALSQIHFLKLFLFQNTQHISYVVVGLLAFVLVLLRGRPGVVGAIAVALSLQAANSSLTRYHYFAPLDDERGLARATESALNFILPRLTEKPVIWIAVGDNHGLDLAIFRGFIRCGYEASFPDKLPDPELHWQPPLAPGRTLVLIDGSSSSQSSIEAALARYGMALDVSASRYISRADGAASGVQITIGKVR